MKLYAHLPLIGFDDTRWTLARLTEYVRAARQLGYAGLAANDHLIFAGPWLDGPTALAAVLPESGDLDLLTSVAIPVVRGPVQTAKALAAIDLLSGGRLTVGVGPGSSPADYAAVGVPFEERWKRLDDAIIAMRALFAGSDHDGPFYRLQGVRLLPRPARDGGPPIWVGSWGSDAGLRRVARLADGWLASAYNTTPDGFRAARATLDGHLRTAGKEPAAFPNGIATMFTYVTDDREEARRVLEEVLAPMTRRPVEDLRDRLLVGPPELCAARLSQYAGAGAQRVCIWPVAGELRQLELVRKLSSEG
jgi:alkanesulfonate monooxygenase SsuD/methylene tetrahydromethanopterin reductase-like flavin-dependent oxidoreductase (luciferase family)